MTGSRQRVASIHIVSRTYGKDQEGELDTACLLEGIMGKGQRVSCGSWPCCSTSLLFDKVCVCENICYTPVSGML